MENTAITNQQGITHDSLQPISRDLLLQKYAHGGEATREEILDRVACGLAKNEADPEWQGRFRSALEHIVLGGRITASAGLENIGTTWVNCFVQPIADSVFESQDGVPGIMEAARQAAQTMRLGGGVGYDFSVIRPKGAWIKRTQSMASGPISYMEIFNAMCTTVVSAGARRGAQIAVLRCDHPDIEEFIVCKKVNDLSIPWDKRPLRGFNISVGIASYTFDVLSRKCKKARADWIKDKLTGLSRVPGGKRTSTGLGDEFAMGWVANIARVVQDFAQPEPIEDAIAQFIAERATSKSDDELTRKPKTEDERIRNIARRSGMLAAEGESINRPVHGASHQLMLP